MHRCMAWVVGIVVGLCGGSIRAVAAEFTAGNLFYTATASDLVVEVTPTGVAVKSYGPFANFDQPSDVAFGPDGRLYVAVRGSNRVVMLDASGAVVGSIGTTSGLTNPVALAFGADGHLLVASENQNLVYEYDRLGTLVRSFGAGSGLLVPRGIACTPAGHVFVSSAGSDRVIEFDSTRIALRDLGASTSLVAPARIELGGDGRLWVASQNSSEVLAFDATGAVVATLGAGTALASPVAGVHGTDGRLYVSDAAAARIVVFDAVGAPFTTITGLTQTPSGLAIAPQRFSVTIKGKADRAGLSTVNVKETATLTVRPGSGLVHLDLIDDTGTALDLATLFSARTWSGTGFEFGVGTNLRTMQNIGVGAESQQTGIATFALKLKGKSAASGAFRAKSVLGSLEYAREGRAFVGSIKSKKALN
ncbi:MAG: NHL repeat-containing protein [Planctomycetes bacterium]|nr:NHL repeat-containing protein [Planctomycetota bacterium]